MSGIPRLVGQHTSNGVVEQRNVGDIFVSVAESRSGKFEYVWDGGISIAAVQASEAPVKLYGVKSRVVGIERVVGGIPEVGGNSTANETSPHLVTFIVRLVFVKRNKNKGFVYKSGVSEGWQQKSDEPVASKSAVGVVTVVSDIGSIERVSRDVVLSNVCFE